jgi:molybdenum cofactor cytidylyltransferase
MGTSKAQLEIAGVTFATRLSRAFAAVCDPVILVTGAIAGITAEGARAVHNPGWPAGQLTSLQVGLREALDAPAVLFAPVDCPLFESRTVAALWAAFAGEPFVIPRYQDRRGHPVLMGQSAFAEILALPSTGQAREVVHRHRPATRYVDVDDAGILADIDTPADYQELIRS